MKLAKGVEPIANHQDCCGNSHNSKPGDVNAALEPSLPMAADEDLKAVITAWPKLPDAIKFAIVSICNTKSG